MESFDNMRKLFDNVPDIDSIAWICSLAGTLQFIHMYICMCRLFTNACEEVLLLQRALKEYVTTIDKNYSDRHEEFFVGFEGSYVPSHSCPYS